MPSDTEVAETDSSAAAPSRHSASEPPSEQPVAPDAAAGVAAALAAAAESAAVAGDSGEGDELIRRMQSALEDDDSVDALLPSFGALQMLSGERLNTITTNSVERSSAAHAAIESERSSMTPAAASLPHDDSIPLSRNLGLGLAALHKLQQQQRMAQGQQQQQQQQQRSEATSDQVSQKEAERPEAQHDADKQQAAIVHHNRALQEEAQDAAEAFPSACCQAEPLSSKETLKEALANADEAAAVATAAALRDAAGCSISAGLSGACVGAATVEAAPTSVGTVVRKHVESSAGCVLPSKPDESQGRTTTVSKLDSPKLAVLEQGGAAAAIESRAASDLKYSFPCRSSAKAATPAALTLPPFTPQAAGEPGLLVEAAVRAEAEAVEGVVGQLQQQVQQLLQQRHQRGGSAAVEALAGIEQRLRVALEAVDADVAALQREAAATANASFPSALPSAARLGSCASDWVQLHQLQQQQRDSEIFHGDEAEGEEEDTFKVMDSMDATNTAAAAAASGSAAPPSGVWSEPCRALLRAALQSAGRQLPRGRRRGARGGAREWGDASRHRPPLDVLCLAAAQTKAECSLTPEEASAAAAAAAVAATAAAANGYEAAAAAAAAAAEALLPPAAAAADGMRRVSWIPAEGPMVESLAAANQSQAFAAGLPLLREICRVATVELRAPPPPAVAAATAAAAAATATTAVGTAAAAPAGFLPHRTPDSHFAAATPAGIAGLRRLGFPGEHQLQPRGPVWVEVPPAEEEEEGPRGPSPPLMSSSCSEQLLLFLKRRLFPDSWLQELQQQLLCCKAQLFLPDEYEEAAVGVQAAERVSSGMQAEPVLRLRRFRRVNTSARAAEGLLCGAAAASAAPETSDRSGPGTDEAGESLLGCPLMVDEALRLLSAQQQKQQQALQQLLLQLKQLSQGISTKQLVLLASLVDFRDPADAAAAAAAVGDPDAAVFLRENSNLSATAAANEQEPARGMKGDTEATRQQQQQQQQQVEQQRHAEQLQKLQHWLSLFHPFGISASRAVALLAAAGEQQQQQLEPVGEPIDIIFNFQSLMPCPEEDPGIVVALSFPYKPGPVQPWKWDLQVAEGGPRNQEKGALRGPLSIQNVRRQISKRQQRLSFLLQQQKIVCRTLYRSWRTHRRQQERRRLASGDIFGWGVLPVRAVDHPSLLTALPAGFRQGNPREPYEKQYSRDAVEEGTNDRSGARRSNDVTGRRTLRGDACNDRQRAKEEAANRESKREWMQANFSNLTGPGVFWRDSCLFSQGQSLRQRLEKQQENSGVHPVELLQTDPDWALFDWERECGYTCNTARVLQPLEQEAERKAVTVWAEAEARTFVEKFLMYPKNFEKIAACLDGKSTRDCVEFYYRFKYKFSLKRRLQELEDGTRVKKRNRHVGSKQIRREELVAEAVAGLSSDCETDLMRSFNGRNLLPFDAFSDHLLQREALQTTLKDPLACRGEDWNDCDSDGGEAFVENMSDGYFLPATIKGLVAPSRVVSISADAALWGSSQRCFVPGCMVIEGPPSVSGEEEEGSSLPRMMGPPTLRYEQLDTLLTCMQASARRFGLPDEEGPSYMTRSRAARSRPGSLGAAAATAGGLSGGLQRAASAGGWRNMGGHQHSASCGTGGGQQSPRAKAMDSLLLRLKGIVRGLQQNAKLAFREKRRFNLEENETGIRSPASSIRLVTSDKPQTGSE
ncbi:hypothetical protein Esti_005563 [Eimeria stiedai]